MIWGDCILLVLEKMERLSIKTIIMFIVDFLMRLGRYKIICTHI